MTALSPSAIFAAWDRLLALFYPEICQICRQQHATFAENYLCLACRSGHEGIQFVQAPICNCCGLPFPGDINVSFECANCRELELHFRHARAAAVYTGVLKEIIHRYKYNHASWFEPFLANLLIEASIPELRRDEWDWIVPIPLHWLKLRGRTFNQAARLAHRLSKATNIPVKSNLLRRIRPTQTQTRLSRAERTENVKRAFAYRAAHRIDGARILLVDDVLTTGATASACAKLLRQNGAAVVDVWTVARGILK
jgi:ComF family protein